MIFDQLNDKQRITAKWLKANGWIRCVWGSPDYYVDPPKDAYGRTRFTRWRSTARWRSNSFVYEKFDHETGIHLVYFPKKFTKYVNVGIDKYPHDMVYVSNVFESELSESERQKNMHKVRYISDIEAVTILAQEQYGHRF